ncbi:hypothetical protein ACFCV3_39190 [Kribbella sp. NPDC056345]|uniref:hypothetical protein n=1 Tax=Kribbella sp. NPDC056345 TaxID=3345789 RepID=UPI0035DFD722
MQFLRNVGEPNDNEFGGGTYGFGKGIFYRLSLTSAILVDTLTLANERRLMGAALGNSWYEDDLRFTGRHWWADTATDGKPDPFLNIEAEELAASLGLPGFADGRTGTDVVLIGADLGTVDDVDEQRLRTVEEAAAFLASSMLWHLWPKTMAEGDLRQMVLDVKVNGQSIGVPEPANVSDLRPFVDSLTKIRGGDHVQYKRTVAPKLAGQFALSVQGAQMGSPNVEHIVDAARPFDGPPHHVARMRIAELVVDYLPTSPHPDPLLRYGAVFKSTEESDAIFASAEPPTHDDWVEKGLSGTSRGVVQGARHFVTKTVDTTLGLSTSAAGGQGGGLGALSSRLASLLPAIDGVGAGLAGPGPGGASRSGARNGTAPRIVEGPRLERYEEILYLVAKVHVPNSPTVRNVRAEVSVVVDGGGRESDPPAGALTPEITGWRSADGNVSSAEFITVGAADCTEWWVYSTYIPDAVVRFKLREETDAL